MGKQIKFLYMDGTCIERDESHLHKNDFINCEYLLIRIGSDLRLFTIIKPSKFLIFYRAKVVYQISIFCDRYSEQESYDYIQPVSVETQSLTDLISLLNCIDRLDVVNSVVTDELDESSFHYMLNYFSVIIYDDNSKVIYEKELSINTEIPFGYKKEKFLKKFRDLYCKVEDIRSDFLVLNKMGWNLTCSITKKVTMNSVMGIYCKLSNMVVFMEYRELIKIMKIDSFDVGFILVDIHKDDSKLLNEDIRNGKYSLLESYEQKVNYYFTSHNDFDNIQRTFDHVGIIANIDFILNLVKISVKDIYDSDEFTILSDGVIQEGILYLYFGTDKHRKELVVTTDSMVSISDIMSQL